MDQPMHRILVVDDNKDAADTVALLLRQLGHDVTQAYDGASAVVAAAEFRPTLVFLDLMMPVVDGFEVARRLRELEVTRHVKIYALTAFMQPPWREATAEASFDGHLRKPVGAEELEQLLATA